MRSGMPYMFGLRRSPPFTSTRSLYGLSQTPWKRRKKWAASSFPSNNVAKALISFAREYGITHIVLGRPGRRKLLRWFEPTLYERILNKLPEVDLVVA